MASKLAVRETGYDDERFEQIVSETLHCIICTHVIKDPVMCQRNEHLFCRACITIHLMYSPTCPTCMEPLTVETLRQPSRTVMNLLSELKIRCEFYKRGCGKVVQLGDLERHVADCGFAPAVCSNEGCQLEVNKQDLLHHETALCKLRRVKCDTCNDVRREMDIVKDNLVAVSEKLGGTEKIISDKLKNNEANVKAVVENVVAELELVQEQLSKQKENSLRLVKENTEIKKFSTAIVKQLEKLTLQTSDKIQSEQMKRGFMNADEADKDLRAIVAGGWNTRGKLNSVEMFNLATGTWTQLQPMEEQREGASSVIYNNQLFIIGGWSEFIEILPLDTAHDEQVTSWESFPVELSAWLGGHCCVVYDQEVLVVGGYDVEEVDYSDKITKISLVPPYTVELLASMPQTRYHLGIAIFGDKILIVGGRENGHSTSALRSVVLYDIAEDEFQDLAPLPYPVHGMATVKWGDDNVMIMGGADSNNQPLNKVLMYNIKTQKSHELPNMKYKREGCVAAVVRDTVIVMGGYNKSDYYLKTVEGFRFDRYSWKELPPMHEARCGTTAVVF